MLSGANESGASTREDLDLVFKALGDDTRRRLLARLTAGPAKVTDLAKPFAMSLPAVGKHLRVLERAGLVDRTIEGRVHWCALNAMPLRNAGAWLDHYKKFWDESLEALGVYLQRGPDGD